MKTRAVRLYGKNDLRLEEFELPPIKEDEILVKVVSDSLCISSWKAARQGPEHKRIPDGVAGNPVIIGHEFCGEIAKVGSVWKNGFEAGEKFIIQPAFNYKGSLDAPGYSYKYCGGDSTYSIMPKEAMMTGSLLKYGGGSFFYGSLSEPMSCIIGAFHAFYHSRNGTYVHDMGIKEGGSLAVLAGAGTMGLGVIDYALHGPKRPGLLAVTDIDGGRLEKARGLYEGAAEKAGVKLLFFNTAKEGAEREMMALTGGRGFDDALVMAPVRQVVEQGDRLLGRDGCLNFFAGPSDTGFSASINFYNVHYAFTHVAATSGGSTADMKEAIALMSNKTIDPAAMITHVGGLDCVPETTLNLAGIPGGKKLIYTHINMPLTAIGDFEDLGAGNELFRELAAMVKESGGRWSPEAEKFLLEWHECNRGTI